MRGDDGSVLPLVVGLVVVVVSLVTVVTDASVLFLSRRELQSIVDGASLAAAQAVDLDAYYAGDGSGDVALDPALARTAARSHVRRSPASSGLTGLRITSVSVAGGQVTVVGRTVVSLPFTSFVTGGRGVPVVADASAVLRTD
jgi:uncharacterized membrane protein